MRIGNKELNENEAEWATKFAEDLANQATKQCVSALNAKFEIDDLKGFLSYVWSKKSKPEPEFETEVDDEEFEEEEE